MKEVQEPQTTAWTTKMEKVTWGTLTLNQKWRTRRKRWRASLGKWKSWTQRGRRPQTWTSSTAKYQSILFLVMIVMLAIWHSNYFRIENLEDLPALERLGFRWNFIKTIENVSHLTALQVTTEQLRDQNRGSKMKDNSGVRAVRQPDQEIRKSLWLGQPQDAWCVSQHVKEDRRAGGSCQVSISPGSILLGKGSTKKKRFLSGIARIT